MLKRTRSLLLLAALLVASGCGSSSSSPAASSSSPAAGGTTAPEGGTALAADAKSAASARAMVAAKPAVSDARQGAERALSPLADTLAGQGKSAELVCVRPVRVAVDADVLERILSPLLENAARFARGRIVLEIREAGGWAVFEIRDDGPGVGPGEHERIFDPGYRGEEPREDGHAGSGLGLSLVRRLARAAGGEVEACASDDGGSFAVRLPAGAAPRRRQAGQR
jgi:signal transduction histidine kinase